MFESLERNKPADAEDSRRGIYRRRKRRRESFQIDPVIDPVDLRRRIWAALAKQLAAVIGFGRDKLCCGADFAQKIVVSQIDHEILAVRGDAEGDAGNFFQEKRGVGCAVGEVDVKRSAK